MSSIDSGCCLGWYGVKKSMSMSPWSSSILIVRECVEAVEGELLSTDSSIMDSPERSGNKGRALSKSSSIEKIGRL